MRTTARQRALATRLARRISDAHWPDPRTDLCPTCGIVGCAILGPALAWLDATQDPYPPPGWLRR
jgi:hypothetical protein